MRGDGGATRIAATARARRARCAAHRACVPGSPSSLARRSASEEAGRWSVPASRSSLARTSRGAGRRKRASGKRATSPASAKTTTPKMRKDRGANCQAPSHEAARNSTDDRERKNERRPHALDHERASRQSRKRAEPRAFGVGADWWFFRVAHRDAIDPSLTIPIQGKFQASAHEFGARAHHRWPSPIL